MKSSTAAISIHLPSSLAEESQIIAAKLHISRAQFIRMAIEHEVKNWQIKQEQLLMANAFLAMAKHDEYLKESKEIMEGFDTPIHDDEEDDEWWKKK
jgi:metal-responsive CopG/Arc/MetJ family transcriptional regulator